VIGQSEMEKRDRVQAAELSPTQFGCLHPVDQILASTPAGTKSAGEKSEKNAKQGRR
jgi:hypothetical protein